MFNEVCKMKKISLQEIYNKYLGKVRFPDTCTIFFYGEEDKETLTKHNSSFIQDCISILKAHYTDSREEDFQKGIKEVIEILEKQS